MVLAVQLAEVVAGDVFQRADRAGDLITMELVRARLLELRCGREPQPGPPPAGQENPRRGCWVVGMGVPSPIFDRSTGPRLPSAPGQGDTPPTGVRGLI